jgi:hypothetical protein
MGTLLESKHASDDDLELYFLNLLHDPHLDRIEEHLLVCTVCIEAAEQLSEDIPLCDWRSVVTSPPKDYAWFPNRSVSLLKHSHSTSGMFLRLKCYECTFMGSREGMRHDCDRTN